MTLSFVEDINIDYTEDGLQEMFLITTPSATAECGCGESFTI
jgi:iron-sulfur cluster assembly protein